MPSDFAGTNIERAPKRGWFWTTLILFCLTSGLFVSFNILKSAPTSFPINTPFVVELGSSTKETAQRAAELNLTNSKWLLYATLRLLHNETGIKASTYVFLEPQNVFELAEKLTLGDHDTNLLALTIIEGESAKQIAKKSAQVLPNFNAAEFLVLAKDSEGRLFPDTYYLPQHFSAKDLFALLTNTFLEVTNSLQVQIEGSALSLDEIIILASIIEREANDETSMKMVSGILQERLRIGMALQVDASMEYVLEKPLKELSAEDLKRESPYNTYLNAGLTPTPIGNPGLASIDAVLNPTVSEYLFYITGSDGEFYYARTFDEHRTNIARYLR
jgi:UPF0755 protein